MGIVAAGIDLLGKQCKLICRRDLIGIFLGAGTARKGTCGVIRPFPLRHILRRCKHRQTCHHRANAKHDGNDRTFQFH